QATGRKVVQEERVRSRGETASLQWKRRPGRSPFLFADCDTAGCVHCHPEVLRGIWESARVRDPSEYLGMTTPSIAIFIDMTLMIQPTSQRRLALFLCRRRRRRIRGPRLRAALPSDRKRDP